MKKAKIILLAVILATAIGASLASKTAKVNRTFYAIGSTILYGQRTSACIIPVNLPLAPHPLGSITTLSSTYNSTRTTTCTCRVIPNI